MDWTPAGVYPDENRGRRDEFKARFLFVIPAKAEILMVQFILHWQSLLKPEIEFKIMKPGDRWVDPL